MTPSIEQASRSTIHWDPTLQFDPDLSWTSLVPR